MTISVSGQQKDIRGPRTEGLAVSELQTGRQADASPWKSSKNYGMLSASFVPKFVYKGVLSFSPTSVGHWIMGI